MTDKIKIEVTKKQLELISFMADKMSRLLMGQLENALEDVLTENLAKSKYNGKFTDEYWEDCKEIENTLKQLRMNCFQVPENGFKGVGYNDNADILHDIHQVIRHYQFLQRGEAQKATVDAYPAFRFGSEPLIKILEGNE